ncbi:glutamate-cysteine ligase family protein, partial [Streptomyces sp. NPDC051130]
MIEPGNSTTSTSEAEVGLRALNGGTAPLTVGVEEEFLLVDARTFRVVPAAPLILATAGGHAHQLHAEGTRYQVELSTPVADSAVTLREELAALRRTLAAAARAHGCRLVAAPSPIVAVQGPLHLTDDE